MPYTRLFDWAVCLCLYTSTRMRGRHRKAMMQAAVAKPAVTVPAGTMDAMDAYHNFLSLNYTVFNTQYPTQNDRRQENCSHIKFGRIV